jgi:hypothetical protein
MSSTSQKTKRVIKPKTSPKSKRAEIRKRNLDKISKRLRAKPKTPLKRPRGLKGKLVREETKRGVVYHRETVSSDDESERLLSEFFESSESESEHSSSDSDLSDFVVSDSEVEFEDGSKARTLDVVEDPYEDLLHLFSIGDEEELFKTFLQYIVQAVVDTEFQKSVNEKGLKQHYDRALKHFYDKLATVAGSTLQSNCWKRTFLKNLFQFTRYRQVSVTDAIDGKCQICNRPHTSLALKVKFSGTRYSTEEFKQYLFSKKVKNDDPGEYSVTYVIGRHCFYRSSRYHAIVHYLSYLAESIKKMIEPEAMHLNTEDILYLLFEERKDWVQKHFDRFNKICTIYRDSESPWYDDDDWWRYQFRE